MSTSTPVLWIPESTLSVLRSLVQASLDEWGRRWLPGAELQSVEVAALSWRELSQQPAEETAEALLSGDAVGRSWRLALAKRFFGAAHEGSPIIDEVIGSASQALRAPLLKKLGATEALPVRRDLPGHWGVRVEASLLGCRWSTLLSADSLRKYGILPTPHTQPVPHWNAEQTFADLPAQLEAQVGDVEIGVQDLLHLAEGDVIVLPQLADAPVSLRCNGSSLLLSGALGASADRMQRTLRLSAQASH